MPQYFPFPVSILAFNRPRYFEKVLRSLSNQTLPLSPELTTIWIDGFSGSRDEHNFRRNNTNQIIDVAKQYFPTSSFFIRERNYGVALQYRDAESHSFSHGTDIAFFFEEDLVVSPRYLQALADLEQKTREYPQIGRIAAHGYLINRQEPSTSGIGEARKTWGFGLRRNQYEASSTFLEAYYEVVSRDSYWKRDHKEIQQSLSRLGITLKVTSQDRVKFNIANELGFISISTLSKLGKYIGRRREHKSLWGSLTKYRKLFNHPLDSAWNVSENDIEIFLAKNSSGGRI